MNLHNPFRTAKKQFKKLYIVTVKEKKNKLFIPLPGEIINSFGIKTGDIAVFEFKNNKRLAVSFVKKTMYSFVESLKT